MKKLTLLLLFCFTISLTVVAQKAKPKPKASTATKAKVGPVTPVAAKTVVKTAPVTPVIPTITLGTQQWATKNLDVTSFANGDKIDQAQTNEEWLKAGNESRAAWCYYDNDPASGILYNWFAVGDQRGLAPKGWHVPTKYEWIPAIEYLGGADLAGRKLKSKTGWEAVAGIDRNGNDSTGFNGLPSGLRFAADGSFDARGTRAQFWTSTNNDSERAAIVVFGISNSVDFGLASFKFGYSVRCVKD